MTQQISQHQHRCFSAMMKSPSLVIFACQDKKLLTVYIPCVTVCTYIHILGVIMIELYVQ